MHNATASQVASAWALVSRGDYPHVGTPESGVPDIEIRSTWWGDQAIRRTSKLSERSRIRPTLPSATVILRIMRSRCLRILSSLNSELAGGGAR